MAKVYFEGVLFGPSTSAVKLSDAITCIQHARAERRKLRKLLETSLKSGNKADEEHARTLLTMSPEALLCAAIEANKKLKPQRRETLNRCLAVPDLIDLTKPLDEPVPFRPLEKKSGGVRMISNPGFKHRTCQQAVLDVMAAYLKPRSFQFKSVHKAIAEVKHRLGEGYAYVARLDIKEFFTSFDAEKLVPELPLPKRVAEHVVVGRHLEAVVDQEKTHAPLMHALPHTSMLLSLARSGIPQGSVCSPIIGMFCTSRLPWKPMAGVIVINYVDDFLVLAKSAGLRDEAVGRLIDAVENLPGGHFTLKLLQKATATRGFNFLGHRLQLVNGAAKASATDANLSDLAGRLAGLDERLWKILYPSGTINPWKNRKRAACLVLAERLALVDGWRSAFSECEDVVRLTTHYICDIEDNAGKIGLSMKEVKASVDPSMEYVPTLYALGK